MTPLGWCLTGVACWIGLFLFALCLCRVAAIADDAIREDERMKRFYLSKLIDWANDLYAEYDHPVYLVGSALTKDNPRDFDIRIIIPDNEFGMIFGDTNKWIQEGYTGNWTKIRWKWSETCVNETKIGYKRTGLNIDFQIHPLQYYKEKYRLLAKIRLDIGT